MLQRLPWILNFVLIVALGFGWYYNYMSVMYLESRATVLESIAVASTNHDENVINVLAAHKEVIDQNTMTNQATREYLDHQVNLLAAGLTEHRKVLEFLYGKAYENWNTLQHLKQLFNFHDPAPRTEVPNESKQSGLIEGL